MVSKVELQKDVGELLTYLHLTSEMYWDMRFIKKKMKSNYIKFINNIKYYKTPQETKEYIKLVYSEADYDDLIGTLTERYYAIESLFPKEEYQNEYENLYF